MTFLLCTESDAVTVVYYTVTAHACFLRTVARVKHDHREFSWGETAHSIDIYNSGANLVGRSFRGMSCVRPNNKPPPAGNIMQIMGPDDHTLLVYIVLSTDNSNELGWTFVSGTAVRR